MAKQSRRIGSRGGIRGLAVAVCLSVTCRPRDERGADESTPDSPRVVWRELAPPPSWFPPPPICIPPPPRPFIIPQPQHQYHFRSAAAAHFLLRLFVVENIADNRFCHCVRYFFHPQSGSPRSWMHSIVAKSIRLYDLSFVSIVLLGEALRCSVSVSWSKIRLH